MCEGGREGRGGRGNEADDDDGDEVNGDEINGDVLRWRAATRNGAALTLSVYNWGVGKGAMSRWWAGWVAERANGRCDFSLVLLSCVLKMAIQWVEQGCERKSSRSG